MYQWVIVLTHTDYHCIYVGSHQIEAPTREKAIEKLKEKTKRTFDGWGDEIEEVYGPFKLGDN